MPALTTTAEEIHERINQGQLIEAGCLHFLKTASEGGPEAATDLRAAFYAGAQHVFSMIVIGASQNGNGISLNFIDQELCQFAATRALRAAKTAGNA